MPQMIEEKIQVRRAKVLLIDDDEAQYHLVDELLKEKGTLFDLEWVDSLNKAFDRIPQGAVDVILLDLFLGDSRGLDTFKRMKARVKDIPIVIVSGLDDEKSAVEAIQQGAQDFLVKNGLDGSRLSRVIQFAIKRHEIQKDPRNEGLVDSLTGLYNKHGFLTMIEPHLKSAQRAKKGFFICFAIMDNLKNINEMYGAAEGDRALLTTAEILQESFRSTDMVGRMGADEFAILTTEQGQYSPKVTFSRIRNNQKYYNAQFNLYRLSISMCAVFFDPEKRLSLEDISAKTDQVFAQYKLQPVQNQFFKAD